MVGRIFIKNIILPIIVMLYRTPKITKLISDIDMNEKDIRKFMVEFFRIYLEMENTETIIEIFRYKVFLPVFELS